MDPVLDPAEATRIAAAIARAIQRVHESYPQDSNVAILHANLEAADAWMKGLEGYVSPLDGTPKQ